MQTFVQGDRTLDEAGDDEFIRDERGGTAVELWGPLPYSPNAFKALVFQGLTRSAVHLTPGRRETTVFGVAA
jgi:hypothetical protein